MGEGRFSIGAYAVIQNEHGDVLLTRRRNGGEWVLPGGTVESEEAPWDALVREVAEETGLDVVVRRLVGVYAKRQERDLVLAFTADVTGGRIRPSDERDRIEFVDPHALPERTAARDRERIADALAGAPPVLTVQPSAGDEPPQGTR